MLLEFSFENANKVLSLFNDGKIANLNIKPVVVDDIRRFVMNYTLLDDLDNHQKSVAMKTLNNPNSYLSRMRTTEIFNQFIENMATDTVTKFELEFSVIDRTSILLNTQVQFAKEANTVTDSKIENCLKELNDVIVKMGIAPVKINGIFKKEGTGKSKKQVPVTVAEIFDALNTVLTENE